MTGCFNTMNAVMPAMIAQRYGKIVNVGGTFGMRGRAGRMAYSASKWGLRGITKTFALEAVSTTSTSTTWRPAWSRDRAFATRSAGNGEAARHHGRGSRERHANEYALRRVSTGEDVANACLFFASDVSRQITGADLPVDGGWAAL